MDMIAAAPAPSDPVVVYTGPTRTGAAIAAAAEADAARDAPPKAGKRSKTAHSKRDDNATPEKSKNQVSVTINPNSTKPPANAKPAASKRTDAKRTGARPASAKPKTAEDKSKP
jgi:D-alanyl-D-alanine carboxypeptidase